MNHLLPYEENIPIKMEELPVPDMQNRIWNSVLAELNTGAADVSLNDKTVSKKISLGSQRIFFGFIISLLITVIVVIVASQKKSTKRKLPPVQETTQPVPFPIDSSANENKKDSILIPFNKRKENNTIVPGSNVDTIAAPTSFNIIPIKSDSGSVAVSAQPLAKDSTIKLPPKPVQKKTIGVTGISDSSYRISGKKDSQ